MKHRISITVDEDTILAVQDILRAKSRSGIFRNKSHFIEYAVKKFLEEKNKNA
jgi:Arc/MetJ-type ribon-helix-helix transcriptional regulator